MIEAKNITTKNVKKGHVDSVLFSNPGYISQGDPFADAGKFQMRQSKSGAYKDAGHDFNFKPAKTVQRKVKADFDHLQDDEHKKKNYRDAEGAVKTEKPNFLTNPPKGGQSGKGVYLGEKIPYVEDPFDRKKELERKELEEHHSKLQDKPFSQKVKQKHTFATIKEAYGEDRDYPQRPPPPKRQPLMTHDVAFKPANPSKKGYNKTIAKFPEYKEDPLKQVVRKQKQENEDDRKWRPNDFKKTVPSSSISSNYKNLKTEFPSIFRKLWWQRPALK